MRTPFPMRAPGLGHGRPLLLAVWLGACLSAPAGAQDRLLDRTLAVVHGQAVTLADVRTMLALGLVEGGGADPIREAAGRLMDRVLMLHEVERFAPPEPPEAAVQARFEAVAAAAGGAAALERVLAQGGFDPSRLRAVVRDDLRLSAYLEQRFPAAAGGPAGGDVATARRRALMTAWLDDLRRRATLVDLRGQ